jgi:uncharacterized repeat protein (TIGR01451 family)
MTHTTPNKTEHRPYRRPYWIGMVVIALTLILLSSGLSVTAAPPNQTVPQPTATPEPPPQPTATSTPRPDDDGDDGDDSGDNDGDSGSSGTLTRPEAEEAAVETLQAAVNVSALNVRAGPGTEFAVIDLLENGAMMTIIGQNEAGDWWLICCVGGEAADEGWVAARFMTPAFDPAGAALPFADVSAVTDVSAAEVLSPPAIEAPLFALELSTSQASQAALQGGTVEVQLVVSNPGDESARNVQLRNEVPSYLTIEEASASPGNVTQSLTDEGNTVIDVRWPELAAGAQVTTTILLRVAPDVLDGTTINNLIAAGADNVGSTSTGVVIGLPPATLPDFQ